MRALGELKIVLMVPEGTQKCFFPLSTRKDFLAYWMTTDHPHLTSHCSYSLQDSIGLTLLNTISHSLSFPISNQIDPLKTKSFLHLYGEGRRVYLATNTLLNIYSVSMKLLLIKGQGV
jgi:hypothetical protein